MSMLFAYGTDRICHDVAYKTSFKENQIHRILEA